MDDTTMQIGLLMEAAQANSKSAEASLKKLKSVTAELAATVRAEVRQAMLEELASLSADSKRAAETLREVQRLASRRTLVWSLSVTLLCSAIPIVLTGWFLPSRAEIVTLRAKHAELTTQIAHLEERGGRIDLRHCGEGARLCVRIDRRAPTYGEQSDYLVVKGY